MKDKILITLFIIVVGGLSISTLIKSDVDFSPNENRYLQKMPKLEVVNILNGKFEKDWESYLSDQIAGREIWVEVKSSVEYIAGIKDINGTYVIKDPIFKKKRLIERFTDEDFDRERYEKNIKVIKKLRERLESKNFKVLLCPSAFYVYGNMLPKGTPYFDEKKAFDRAKDAFCDDFIDIRKTLKESPEDKNKFYFTDHHWTDYGAYLGFKCFMEKNRRTCPEYEKIDKISLTDGFRGTLYSKVLFTKSIKDEITTPIYVNDKVKLEINGKTYDSILFKDRLNNKDKYEVFLGGNYNRADIETGRKGDKILVLKDSYANSFIPYMLREFSHITMIDTRFFRGNIEELAEEYDEILVLYSINNFAKEKIVSGNGIF